MMINNNKKLVSQPPWVVQIVCALKYLGYQNRVVSIIFIIEIEFNLYGSLITRLSCPALQNIKLQNPKEISPVKDIGKLSSIYI